MAFNSSEIDLSQHRAYLYSMPTENDVKNGHFVRHKQTGNEMQQTVIVWTCV